ncbi:sodium-dependent dopamine transporter-like isoform X2 [Ornithodoros turicata]|uniref:sodium-dependent dopamine transporter-like isoform X2 n=1 Tax=Ornithodoros turicata TaxID=34597 RepID=UPI0031391DD2
MGSEYNVCAPYPSRTDKLVMLFIMTAGSAKATQFPTMFIVYGGVPFMVAYLVFLLTIAMPIMHLESTLGQFSGEGNSGTFSTVPLFMGLGYTMSLYATLHAVGDSITLSDCVMNLLSVLLKPPWAECHPKWVLHNRTCYVPRSGMTLCRTVRSRLMESYKSVDLSEGLPVVDRGSVVLVPSRVYVLKSNACTDGLYSTLQNYYLTRQHTWANSKAYGELEGSPLFSMVAVWMLVFAMTYKGFIKIKRFFYVAAFTYLTTMALLLLRGVTLSGAMGGLSMIFYADWSCIVNLEMWFNALYISLESVGVTGTIYLGVVKFNSFKNDYKDDVKFVLVADTASKGIGTAITFMFLGHLSSSIDADISVLVRTDFKFIINITPQAVDIISYPEFWSQVHSIWLLSTILPKFMLVPDILMDVLSPTYIPLLEYRTMAHFFVCTFLILVSILICSPVGMSIAQILVHNHDQRVRYLILLLESVVILQIYGMRRLLIDCKMMANDCPSLLVRLCWTSIVPLTTLVFLIVKIYVDTVEELATFPLWVRALCSWFDLVELSFIPVFAAVVLHHAHFNLRQVLAPLPTWGPDRWELQMMYRQLLAAEGMHVDELKRREFLEAPKTLKVKTPVYLDLRAESTAGTSTDRMGTHVVVITERSLPSTSATRYESTGESDASKAKTKAKCQRRDSGSLAVSRRLSSVRASAEREWQKQRLLRASPSPTNAIGQQANADEHHLQEKPATEDKAPLPVPASRSRAALDDHESIQQPKVDGTSERRLTLPKQNTITMSLKQMVRYLLGIKDPALEVQRSATEPLRVAKTPGIPEPKVEEVSGKELATSTKYIPTEEGIQPKEKDAVDQVGQEGDSGPVEEARKRRKRRKRRRGPKGTS